MSEPPNLHALAARLRELPDALELDEQIEVAGETYYVKEIKKLFRGRNIPITEKGSTVDGVPTVLVPTPWNEHDPNAVAVLCDGHQVGHVPADLAKHYHRPLAIIASHGFHVPAVSRVWAKSDNGIVRARATVLAPEHEVIAEVAPSVAGRSLIEPPAAAAQLPATPAVEAQATVAEAGWYPDPEGMAPFRYWDGQAWTSRIRMKL